MEMAKQKQASILYALWKRVRRALAADWPDVEDEMTAEDCCSGCCSRFERRDQEYGVPPVGLKGVAPWS